MEVAEQFPPEIQEVAKFGQTLEATDETGRTLAISEFAQVSAWSWSVHGHDQKEIFVHLYNKTVRRDHFVN